MESWRGACVGWIQHKRAKTAEPRGHQRQWQTNVLRSCRRECSRENFSSCLSTKTPELCDKHVFGRQGVGGVGSEQKSISVAAIDIAHSERATGSRTKCVSCTPCSRKWTGRGAGDSSATAQYPLTAGRIRDLLRFVTNLARTGASWRVRSLQRPCRTKPNPTSRHFGGGRKIACSDVETYLQVYFTRFSLYGEMRNEVVADAASRTCAKFRAMDVDTLATSLWKGSCSQVVLERATLVKQLDADQRSVGLSGETHGRVVKCAWRSGGGSGSDGYISRDMHRQRKG